MSHRRLHDCAPPPIRSHVRLAALAFAATISLVWLAYQSASCSHAKGSQVPDPNIEMTVEQLLARIIDDTRRLGEKMPPEDPRHGYGVLRIGLGQNLCGMAYWLDGAGLTVHRNTACSVLWEWWPDVAVSCPTCER